MVRALDKISVTGDLVAMLDMISQEQMIEFYDKQNKIALSNICLDILKCPDCTSYYDKIRDIILRLPKYRYNSFKALMAINFAKTYITKPMMHTLTTIKDRYEQGIIYIKPLDIAILKTIFSLNIFKSNEAQEILDELEGKTCQ